jgi:dTMP kinase
VADRLTGRGVFITLEGPDGAGKSSQLSRLAERIGGQVVVTREPGGTQIGERIRELLLRGEGRDPLADALLFNAARRQLVAEVIRPALERGATVICDRFTDSTLAYQGYGAGVPLDQLRALADIATGGLRPDRTILFDLPPEAGLRRRAAGAGSEVTRFESADEHDLAFHQRVRAGYLELAAAEPDRWRVIHSDQDADTVASELWTVVSDLVGRR